MALVMGFNRKCGVTGRKRRRDRGVDRGVGEQSTKEAAAAAGCR